MAAAASPVAQDHERAPTLARVLSAGAVPREATPLPLSLLPAGSEGPRDCQPVVTPTRHRPSRARAFSLTSQCLQTSVLHRRDLMGHLHPPPQQLCLWGTMRPRECLVRYLRTASLGEFMEVAQPVSWEESQDNYVTTSGEWGLPVPEVFSVRVV